MNRVLVTGATGFIGRRLCGKLLAQGCVVRGVSLREPSVPGIELLRADIAAPNLDARIFAGVDTVFHLAGKAHALSETHAEDESYFRINTEGTRHVLAAAKNAGVRRLVFLSSVKAMTNDTEEQGTSRAEAWTENHRSEPDTPYGKSKLAAEELVLHGGFVPEPVVLRLCMVYGPHAKGNVEKMIQAVRRGRFPPLTEVGNKRSMVHVDDVAQAAVLAAEHPKAVGEIFIVSDGQTYSTRQMYELICRALGVKIPGWNLPLAALRGLGLAGDLFGKIRGKRFCFDSDALHKLTGNAWFSSEKIQREIGFKPEWNFERALRETDGKN